MVRSSGLQKFFRQTGAVQNMIFAEKFYLRNKHIGLVTPECKEENLGAGKVMKLIKIKLLVM